MKIAFVTGITGQDGALLAALLLDKSYVVHGLVRRASLPNTSRISSFMDHPNLHLHYGDVSDAAAMIALITRIKPQEIYNLAAQSDVHASFTMPSYTLETNASGTLSILEAMRMLPAGSCKFYQASTSEIFGDNNSHQQNELTPFQPCSPYGISKLCAYWLVVSYRQAYGMFAANGILFNHESPLRGEMFVSRKIARCVAAWMQGKTLPLTLGALDSMRDWGHARDYVDGMWRILQHAHADDYVLATGQTYSVREFVERSFGCIDRVVRWQGKGVGEQGIDSKTGEILVTIDPHLFRPVEINVLCGDATKAHSVLGWHPQITFPQLVEEMVQAEIAALK